MTAEDNNNNNKKKVHPKAIPPYDLIRQAIRDGAPLYNEGRFQECCTLYSETIDKLLLHQLLVQSSISNFLQRAMQKAKKLISKDKPQDAAWELRYAMDDFVTGYKHAELTSKIHNIVEIKDRTYLLKTYSKCFVGKDAVTVMVNNKLAKDRNDAVEKLNQLQLMGMLDHVTSEHQVKDETLFYKFIPNIQIRKALDNFITNEDDLRTCMVMCSTLLHRLKQAHTHPSLGVLRLDYDYPPAPGDIDHSGSYDYPVYYRVVPGLTFQMCQKGKMTPEVEKNFDQAVLWLANHKEVSAITGDCGFMMWFVDRVKQINTKKPVLLSSLLLLPSITASFSSDDKVIIVTANGKSLDPMQDLIKRQCGIDARDLRFIYVGCENVPYFGNEVEQGLKVDVEKAEPGIVSNIVKAVQDHPEARAILLECTELPPYADAVRQATGLPVFDSITNCDFVMQGFLDNSRFGLNGWYEEWDGIQEEYQLGQELSVEQRQQCIWCQKKDW